MPRFEKVGDQVFALDEMPNELEVSLELISGVDQRYLERHDNVFEIRCANGRWVYEITEERFASRTLIGRIRYREDS